MRLVDFKAKTRITSYNVCYTKLLRGNPLATLQHCMGTRGDPDDAVLDFISNTVVAEAPLDEAALSLVEIRTLGGAAVSGMKRNNFV